MERVNPKRRREKKEQNAYGFRTNKAFKKWKKRVKRDKRKMLEQKSENHDV